jgi:hypothetical protein
MTSPAFALASLLTRDDDRVVPFREWCAEKGICVATGRRLIASGRGPKITRLSERRIGIRVRDDREWLERSAEKRG